MSLAVEKYVALTTYKKDGAPRTLPVWIADAGSGKLCFTTFSSSWKVRRLASNSAVKLQPSDAKGTPKEGSSEIEGTAEIVKGPEFERLMGILKMKYGWQYTVAGLIGKFMKLIGKGTGIDCAIVITPSNMQASERDAQAASR